MPSSGIIGARLDNPSQRRETNSYTAAVGTTLYIIRPLPAAATGRQPLKTTFLAVLAVTAAILAPAASHAAELSQDQIKSEIVGKTWNWKNSRGEGTMQLDSSGAVNVTTNSSLLPKDSGTWRLDGNSLCTKFKKLRRGKEECATYSKNGNAYVTSTGLTMWQ